MISAVPLTEPKCRMYLVDHLVERLHQSNHSVLISLQLSSQLLLDRLAV